MQDANAEDENFWDRGTYEFEPLEAGFAQGGVLDDVLPGPLLAAAVGAAADGGLSGASDNELLGLMRAARKAGAWLAWAQTMAEAEYAARNLEWDPQAGKQVVNEFAAQEVAQEIPLSGGAAKDRLQRSHAARQRLPRCLAMLNEGQIDDFRMRIIAETTANVDPELAPQADRLIAGRAAGLTPGQLRRLCTRVVMTVDPAALEENRRGAAKTKRVEIGPEYSGNASVAAREIPVTTALAIKQQLTRWAKMMRKAGLAGTLDNLRADALTALVLERQPVTGTASPAGAAGDAAAGNAGTAGEGTAGSGDRGRDEGPWDGAEPADQDPSDAAEDPDAASYDPWAFPADTDGESNDDQTGDARNDATDGTCPGARGNGNGSAMGSPAAVINVLVTAASLDGTSAAPAEIAGFGLLDADSARQLVAAASHNPATRFCVTVTGDDGTAVAHGCIQGPHPWTPPHPGAGGNRDGPPATGPPPTGFTGFLSTLNVRLEPVASQQQCDHRHQEPQHDPSRTLTHLTRARNATCATPGCGAPAVTADLDHTCPYESGGQTCECNLDPRCRRHHRLKQHRQWRVEQIQPGITRWTGPSGRSRTVYPTRYHL